MKFIQSFLSLLRTILALPTRPIHPQHGRLQRRRPSHPIDAARLKRVRQRRRLLLAAVAVAACLLLPLGATELVLYQQNLGMARESFPMGPCLQARDRLLVIVPHCDDETLGAGGTIAAARAQGIAVRVVFLTNGDGSRSTQIAEDARRLRRNSFLQLAQLRQREATTALGELGVAPTDVIFLGYPDGGTAAMWQNYWSPHNLYTSPYTRADHSPYANSRTPGAAYCGTQVLNDVTSVITAFRPTIIFTTHPSDTHPDHWAAYAYANAAVETLRLQSGSKEWARSIQLLTFLVHRGLWPAPHGYHPEASLSPPAALADMGTRWVQVPLDESARAAKKAALARYASQMAFTPHYLRSFLRRNELFGRVPVATLDLSDTMRKVGLQHTVPLVEDPTRDSPLHDLWASADLQSVSLYPSSNSTTLTARIELAQPPSRRLRYRLVLHTVTADKSRAWVIEIRQRRSSLRAWLRPADVPAGAPSDLPARLVNGDIEVDLPCAALGITQQKAARQPLTLLLSVSTYLGNACLDQTQTGTLRLLPLPTEKPKPRDFISVALASPTASRSWF